MRTQKALYNIVSMMSYEIVAMICGLILPRFILAAYGSRYNGVISSITQFLNYISILNIGIAGSTRVAIYKANAKGSIKEVSAILKATENYMRKVAMAFVVYTVLLTFFFPYIVQSDFEWMETASLVIIISIGIFAEYFFGITYKTFLMSNQSMYIYNNIQIGTKIANTLVSILLIKCGQSIQLVKFGSTICYAATPIILHYYVINKYKIIRDIEPDNSALKQRRDVMAHSIANCIHMHTDIFLLTLFTTPEIVSVYSVYTLVLGSLNKLQNVFTTGLEAAFGDLWAREEYVRFEINFNIFEYMIYSFVSVVFSCAAILILPFISIYTKGIRDVQYILPDFAFLTVITYAVFCIRSPYLIIVQAAGHYRETRNGAFAEAAINFTISLLGVFRFGLIGVTLGTMAANIFRTMQYAIYISDHLVERSFKAVLRRMMWLSLNIAIIMTLRNVLPTFEINTWIQWTVNGLYYFFIALVITLMTSFVFYRSDLTVAINIAKQIIYKKRHRRI